MTTTEDLASPARTSYDEVPYTSHPFPQSHPDRLATVAALLGLKTAPVAHCRVLELGSASGGNLIPMALTLPESQFIGLDLSARQVEDGRKVIDSLGLTNVELRHMSILDVGPELGQFDYIICHGVYSWVPDTVRDKILAVCSTNLTPEGIAYVSYNTYPGWHMRGMIRDMMVYHAQKFDDAKRKVSQARALINFLAESAPDQEGPYGALLKSELKYLREKSDSYLLHDYLEEVNDPIYFYQFVQAASQHGLAYVGEAAMETMAANTFPAKVEASLDRVSRDRVQREQYMDFLRNRTFRRTLLCHADRPFKHRVEPARVCAMYVASSIEPTEPVDFGVDTPSQFKGTRTDRVLTTPDPLVKAALLELGRVWPGSLAFGELCQRASDRLSVAGRPVHDNSASLRLAASLLNCYLGSLVELSPRAADFVTELSERPLACPLVRLQAKTSHAVTNRRHQVIGVNEAERCLLALLDGQHDTDRLRVELVNRCRTGELTARREGEPVTDPDQLASVVTNVLPNALARFVRSALLIG